ncbi:MAG: OmpH family outer membrane protein [Phycisphaerae bacterium]|nr:OmpH family outer membrane protein [Phycisphaerae bacterium]
MKTADRLVVVTSLLVAVSSLALHFAPTGGAFAANPVALANDLGPADGLLLNELKSGAKEASPVRLRVDGQRLSWDDRMTSKAWAVGAVHVDRAMKALLNGPSYADKRKELEETAKQQDAEFGARLEALRNKYPNVTPQSPEAPQAQAESQALAQEYERWRQGSMRIQEKLFAEQIEAAYRELVSAVETVCEKEKIDMVVRFIPTANPFEVDNLAGAREQVVSRTFLKYPEAVDITAEVLKALNVTG